jgi:hypothetical protein
LTLGSTVPLDFATRLRQNPHCLEHGGRRIVSELEQKTRTFSFNGALREKFHLNSAHPDLHKWIYALCVPPAVVALNAVLYYVVHGEEARWPAFPGSPWAADTFAAPWISLIANVAGTVLFVMFVRHKRVRTSTKVATAALLSGAWLFTLIAFLLVE